jgi:ATP-dependent DNA helicase RecQ
MAMISGVGEQKLARYAEDFLAVINQFPRPEILDNNLSDTVNETLQLFQAGLDIEAIAARRSIAASTVLSHMAEAIEAGLVGVRDVVDLSAEAFDKITTAMEEVGTCEEGRLKPLFEALDERYDYDILRCVMAEICV